MTKRHEVVSKKPRKVQRPRNEVTLRITVKAPGLIPREVAEYAASAIDGWSGQFDADDARRNVRVVEVQRLGWITDL